MSGRIFITGIGVVSAIGNNVQENYQKLITLQSGIDDIQYLDTIHKGILPAGEVKLSNQELAQRLDIKDSRHYTRTTLLGMMAAKEAFENAGISDTKKYRTGLISASTVGGMDSSENFYKEFISDHSSGDLNKIITHDCGDSTEKIADYLGIKDHISTISTACSSSANAAILGARLIKNNILDRVLIGGTDALTKFTINGFNTLMILDPNLCTPFDENRKGLNLGEGAGFIVMESEEVVRKENKKPLAELTGYGNANDAFHQTASSPEGYGAFLAMQKALQISGLNISDIDYINVHGTGTPNNDSSEGKALERLFEGNVPDFSSTKSYTGHTLAACGGIEAVFSILAIQNNIVFPNLRFKEKIKEHSISPVTELKNKKIRHVLSNSFGFGGNNTSLIFSIAE